MKDRRLRIAVIGSGAAGIGAAYLLQHKHDVTIYERNDYIGGHTHTVIVSDGPDAGTAVDTGFIVLNDRTYPTLNRFLSQLKVPIRDSEMSFSFTCERRGFFYNGSSLNGLFAQRRNLFNMRFLRMIREIFVFNRRALKDLQAGRLAGLTLDKYLQKGFYSKAFRDDYLFPMAAAIWSTAPTRMQDFPAEYIVGFYENHGLLSLRDRPQWKTVVGGSHQYVKAFLKNFRGDVRLNTPIRRIRREAGGVAIELPDHDIQRHDLAVIATHADEALRLLADPSPDEKRALGAWTYERNRVTLHTDESVMPLARRAWAAWNYAREAQEGGESPVSLTYDMNRLQGLKTKSRYFVSVNRHGRIAPDSVVRELEYTHPVYTFDSLHSHDLLKSINGRNNTYYCGSYFGYGFHEDAIHSGAQVAAEFGLTL